MSLINKMLQDLDARGGNGARGADGGAGEVRPVSYESRGSRAPLAAGIGVLVVALGAAGWYAWTKMRTPAPAAKPAVVSPSPAPAQPATSLAADTDEQPPAQPGGIAPSTHRAAGEKMAEKMAARNAAARGAKAAAPASAGAVAQPAATGSGKPVVVKRKMESAMPRSAAAKTAAPVSPLAGTQPEAALTSQQRAENEYRRALVKLQDARVSEALAGLEQAVYLYPRHDAARQTLISLLIEGGRQAEAMRHLAFAIGLDPRQANLAMLLARMQLEHGGNAQETLARSLPHAESNADYRALLAGVLQRANRHAEAAEHYQAAVRLQPANAVWWMGLGISLQAEKRNAEARSAFQRARDSGQLTPELQNFVERRLQQLD